MYFDSHAHLDDARFQPDFDDILARMRENGVTGMMNIGCDLPSSERSVALAERYDWIWAAVGSHPDDADHVDEARIAHYRALCQNPRVRAIGEIGLDYHYEDIPREIQKNAFRMQLALAREMGIREVPTPGGGCRLTERFAAVTVQKLKEALSLLRTENALELSRRERRLPVVRSFLIHAVHPFRCSSLSILCSGCAAGD